jgi:hypothetical protein
VAINVHEKKQHFAKLLVRSVVAPCLAIYRSPHKHPLKQGKSISGFGSLNRQPLRASVAALRTVASFIFFHY